MVFNAAITVGSASVVLKSGTRGRESDGVNLIAGHLDVMLNVVTLFPAIVLEFVVGGNTMFAGGVVKSWVGQADEKATRPETTRKKVDNFIMREAPLSLQ